MRKHGITLEEYRNTARLYVARGSDHYAAKLTPETVRAIRKNKEGKSDGQWAKELGVSRVAVCNARLGTTWASVRMDK